MQLDLNGLLNLAGATVALVLGVSSITGLVLRGIGRIVDRAVGELTSRLEDQMAEVNDKLDFVTHEVNLDHGQSLKDGVKLIAQHLGIEFDPPRLQVRVKVRDETDERDDDVEDE